MISWLHPGGLGDRAHTTSVRADHLLVEDLDLGLDINVGSAGPISVSQLGVAAVVRPDMIVADELGPRTLRMGRSNGSAAHVDAVAAVPPGSAVSLRRVSGDVRIGDTCGPLVLDHVDAARVQAGRVTELALWVGGDSVVELDRADADHAEITVSGNGRVRVGGVIRSLVVRVSDQGCADFNCVTLDADLSIVGDGSINLLRARHSLHTETFGSGKIRVCFPPPLALVG